MSKKVMIINGSPRKSGNTATVARWVGDGIEEAGGTIEYIDAARLTYKTHGCTSCLGCQQSKEFACIIKDEASEIIARIPEQDIVIFASPVYFMGFSAQIKHVIDRMFSLFKLGENEIVHHLDKTEFGLVVTGGGDEGSGIDLVKANMGAIAGLCGKSYTAFAAPFCRVDTDTVSDNQELQDKAHDYGYNLI